MSPQIKVCVDRILPPDKLVEASRRAIQENPSNARSVHFTPGMGAEPLPPNFMALLTGRKWQVGRTLRVRFLEGSPVMQDKVQVYAKTWLPFTNLKLVFGNDPQAEIRIGFEQDGSWSYIGTDALSIPANEKTMNFGWLTDTTEDGEYSRVVTHEFGHALGCIHEHQSPAANIPWDKDAVYKYYMGPPNNWTKEGVDSNLFQRYSQNITQFSAFDRDSIMLYAVPNEFTIGDFEVGWNTQLSALDKEFIAVAYPAAPVTATELAIGGPRLGARIGAHGEEDLYKFTVQTAGRYLMETRGWTDVVMSLWGPNDPATLLTEDDNSGWFLSARIIQLLQPGTYYLRVRHHNPKRTGSYSIWVKTAPK
jgi:hypothetical protein